jgi:hypothetical protein
MGNVPRKDHCEAKRLLERKHSLGIDYEQRECKQAMEGKQGTQKGCACRCSVVRKK